ncbi:MAG TPA: hypothetical protein VF286_04575 [Acidiphilium sp.]
MNTKQADLKRTSLRLMLGLTLIGGVAALSACSSGPAPSRTVTTTQETTSRPMPPPPVMAAPLPPPGMPSTTTTTTSRSEQINQ